jgi:DNA topoisomerase-1
MSNLVIVESPTKAKTLKKYLGSEYSVQASMGHIRDLPKSKIGVDTENNFEPDYEMLEGKSKTVSLLKKEAKDADIIYLAMDPDREGEAIAFHVKYLLSDTGKTKKSTKKTKDFQRVTFHEITKSAILEAMAHPGEVNANLVDAQQARRVVDRLVGYNLSPVLWRKVRRGLSAGRVQSVALRLIVEREQEIGKFKGQEYWMIRSKLKTQNSKIASKNQDFEEIQEGELIVELFEVNGKKVVVKGAKDDKGKEVMHLNSKQVVEPVVSDLKKAKYVIDKIERKERKQNPYPPFTTSTLQQGAANVLGWSGKQTMRIAQQLYEAGLITYHRTDSTNLAAQAVEAARAYASQKYGKEYVAVKPIFYKTKSKSAQEAHEAIRPTDVNVMSAEGVAGKVTDRHEKLYQLIWNRFMACQMAPVILDQTTVHVTATRQKKYQLRTTGSVVKFEGWKVLHGSKLKTNNSKPQLKTQNSTENELPELNEGEDLVFVDLQADKKETLPPPRFNDASLVKELEKRGIGRPSTYASIISVLEDRAYVERDERRFVPTAVGNTVVEFLNENFKTVMDYEFTAKMEDDLDEIANGNKEWRNVMAEFWGPFEKTLKEAGEAKRVQVPVEETGRKCPECKEGELVIRSGRFGKFISCNKFPECKYTERLVEKLEGFPCPECGGDVVIKRTKRGRSFYGCSTYPKCEYASWKDPREKSNN